MHDSGRSRAFSGAIVTFNDLETGRVRVEHRAGYSHQKGHGKTAVRSSMGLTDVLRALMDEADNWEGDWKVRCISTPASIYLDLVGRDATLGNANKPLPSYEATLLARAGRIDMWEGRYRMEIMERRRRAVGAGRNAR